MNLRADASARKFMRRRRFIMRLDCLKAPGCCGTCLARNGTPGPVIRSLGEDGVSVRQIVGLVLVVFGIAALVWGGVFWTDRDTVLDAGPVEITTENREGVALPPVVGIVSLVAGAVLLLIPKRSGA
jgi:hypothetical protein